MKTTVTTKTLHPRNLHNERYDFKALIETLPALKPFVTLNKYNDLSIDFSNADAVMTLNKALLLHFYNIEFWEIPKGYLCPPIPGRVDYLHHIADLLALSNKQIPPSKGVRGLDIGSGANCIYPILGNSVYEWEFTASDIDKEAIENMKSIVKKNRSLMKKIKPILQMSTTDIFKNIIQENDRFDFTMCNPPFHKSKKEATQGSKRKVSNLSKGKTKKVTLNFGGQSNELWCKGGELQFIKNMIHQSHEFRNNCCWFTTLVSKGENLKAFNGELKKVKPNETKIIEMKQGNKITRFLAWTFLSKQQRVEWFKNK